jgi:hypothetical protein
MTGERLCATGQPNTPRRLTGWSGAWPVRSIVAEMRMPGAAG